MNPLPQEIFHIEFTTPIADTYQTLNFYPISGEKDLQDLPDLIPILKRMQDQENNYLIFSNIHQITKLSQERVQFLYKPAFIASCG